MPANYLHGVEVIKVDTNSKPIRLVKTSVIGIIGTAPIHLLEGGGSINDPQLILSDQQAVAKFGVNIPGYTLPENIAYCQLKGAATIIAVNVFDPSVHKTAVTAEAVTLGSDRTATLAHPGVANLVVKNQAGTTTYVQGTDYAYDAATGVITGQGATLIAAVNLKVDYDYADPTKVTPADIIGGIDAAGRRLGMQAWLDARSKFGFVPRILVAPGYSSLATVAAALYPVAERLRAIAYVDAPVGTTFDDALAGRGPSGDINFFTSQARAQLFFPHLKIGDKLVAYSALAAGMRAWIDNEYGYWYSLSNFEIPAITGTEIPITAAIDDATTEANLLNEQGITTVFSDYGTGYRTWGNRTAVFPTDVGIESFETQQRVDDVIRDSIVQAMLPYIDRPINMARLDAITESVRAFMRKQTADGATAGGNCWYTVEDNPASEVGQGHVTLQYDFVSSPPMERLTFRRSINLGYLGSLFKGGA